MRMHSFVQRSLAEGEPDRILSGSTVAAGSVIA
jgi:hypothetical protein